jgi:Homeodomain-like domain-containing protein
MAASATSLELLCLELGSKSAQIVLLTGNGVGTNEIMRRTGTSKVTVWRWQERFMRAGVAGLVRDKTVPHAFRHCRQAYTNARWR